VINPLISGITNIGLDHTQFLGETLPLIATEKAGIIKDGTPVVIGETQEDILHVFLEKAKLRGAKIVFADQQSESIALSGLVDYQRKNAQTAVVAIKELRAYGFEISNNHLVKGIENMVRNTGLRGRWEIIGNKPLVIADTAHNKEGLIYTMKQLLDLQRTTIRMVFGMVDDKNTDAIMGLLPKDAVYYLCEPSIPRAKPIQELVELFDKEKLNKKIFSSVSVALNAAIADSQEDDVVYVGGSTFVVADALKNY
jgi:dihydrofolate synthase/folylpolyglutamate synthase